jgi:hypothetical protein
MIRIEMSRAFPVSVNDAFRYITELKNWNIYWPGFVRIIDSTSARWREPDDNIVLVIRLLGRDVELFMTLTDFQQDSHVFYRSSQRGFPDAQHERRWITTSDGCEYQIIVSLEPRRDLRGIFDRLVLQQSVWRMALQTLKNLDTIFTAYHVNDKEK